VTVSEFQFAKSSYSAINGECLEVATNVPGTIAVRDSKDSNRPILRFAPGAWSAFRTAITRGTLAR
jgi:hypothetical protein